MTFDVAPSAHEDTPLPLLEVWASEDRLLSFDGRVLELFGAVDVHRVHIAFGPRLVFSTLLTRPRLTIESRTVSIHVFFDAANRAALDRLDDALRTAAQARSR